MNGISPDTQQKKVEFYDQYLSSARKNPCTLLNFKELEFDIYRSLNYFILLLQKKFQVTPIIVLGYNEEICQF